MKRLKISEEKESLPSQSSDDNKEENKDSDVHSDDDKEENKGSYVNLSSSLPVRNQQRKRERNEDDISFLERIGKIFRFTQLIHEMTGLFHNTGNCCVKVNAFKLNEIYICLLNFCVFV